MARSDPSRASWIRSSWIGAALWVSLVPGVAAADPPAPALEADISCKVDGMAAVCTVTAKPSLLSHITYSRADVISAPAFLKVLIGSVDYSETRDQKPRLKLAFMGKSKGSGDVIVKVQAMVCADNGTSCPALSKMVTTRITLGS